MKILSTITIISILLLVPHVSLDHLGTATDSHLADHKFQHDHHTNTSHTHHTQPTHAHNDSTKAVSHHHHIHTHSRNIKFLPAMRRVITQHLALTPIHSPLTATTHYQSAVHTKFYPSRMQSPKQALYLTSCAFIVWSPPIPNAATAANDDPSSKSQR